MKSLSSFCILEGKVRIRGERGEGRKCEAGREEERREEGTF